MGFNWEQVLDAEGDEIADAYEDSASDALYQDHPRAAPGPPVDPGDEKIVPLSGSIFIVGI
ncbi:hypothetical protein [Arthrobacter castelli]|uniref:hypothetical protein n=1 Tax=Arthrobacter castelli TaxID=271431 RepID=UPI00041982EA|nr:hypothetical protein [Arthrobacter castelli]